MSTDPSILPDPDPARRSSVPPVIGVKPAPSAKRESGGMEGLLVIVLSVYLIVFLIDAVVSFADASLILFFNWHILSFVGSLVSLFAIFMTIVIYALMGLTPMIPKKIFLPLTLFNLVAMLAVVLLMVYYYDRGALIACLVAACQIFVGLGVLCRVQGGFKFHWPLVNLNNLNFRRFSWGNLSGFVLINILGLVPAVTIYLFFVAALAVNHFSEGFVALRPGGILVQVRKYVRADGKVIELFPMAHIADAGFYQKVSRTFPTNCIILMEGVTDSQNLLTNKISYKRMARSLGLAEQHEVFNPDQGEVIPADIDIDQFSKETIGFLNLVMLFHAQGLKPAIIEQLMEYSPSPHFEDRLFDDLLRRRNEHLMEEIKSHLAESNNLMVPWGAAHMPGIAKEIQKDGFRLEETQEYRVIRFRGF